MYTHALELSVLVHKPQSEVFAYFTDWPRQGEWMLGTRVEARGVGSAGMGHGEGAEIAGFTGIGPIGFWDTMTITSWQPPANVEVLHTGWLVRGTGYMRVVKVDEHSSIFVWGEEVEIPLGLFGKIGFLIVKPLFMSGIRYSLRRFARACEAL